MFSFLRLLPPAAVISTLVVSCGGSILPAGIPRTQVVGARAAGDSITVIPGPEYAASELHRFWFGDHYRDLWTMPVTIPVLDLEGFAGGLTPVEAGGGFQTKSLRFMGADGRFYKFRSVNKDPRAVLPLELRETIAGDLAQDHISTSHPCAALIVDELGGAVGVPRLNPTLVYLPDSELLGPFVREFGGLLGIIELYPDAGEDVPADFLGARKIRNTLKMFRGMEDDSEDRPDPLLFLNARFLDLLTGDWDRHVKQWKWAQFKEEGRNRWVPVPMDRDQALVRLDGVFPSIAAMSITQFTDFEPGVPNIDKLTFSGRFLDRRLLVGIDRSTWDSVAASFVGTMTDSLIEYAVSRMPPEYAAADGERIAGILKARRDLFMETAREFYLHLAAFVDIHLSDKREFVSIERRPDGDVVVTAWRRNKEDGGPDPVRQVYHRIFDSDETREIRIYALGANDRIHVAGVVSSSITVRVVGGKGDDEFADESVVEGPLWGFIPFISSSRPMTFFYDHQGENLFMSSTGSTVIDREPYESPPGGIAQY